MVVSDHTRGQSCGFPGPATAPWAGGWQKAPALASAAPAADPPGSVLVMGSPAVHLVA